MDGLSLDSIMGILRSFLPVFSYYINTVNRLFDVFLSFFDLDFLEGDETVTE